ncbi:MAG: hypothetical protein AAF492_08810, partial [Verrucomicrobiota bacterium]
MEVRKNGISNTRLHISEIEVFLLGDVPDELDGDGTSQNNIVLTATPGAETPPTSTTIQHGLATSVYDGDLESGGSVWSTLAGQPIEPRYMLDLGATYPIDRVRVWGRNDSCCQDRLENFDVTLYADDGGGLPGAMVNTDTFPGVAPPANAGHVEFSFAFFNVGINQFTADRFLVPTGMPVTLSWEVNPDYLTVSIDQGVGDMTLITDSNGFGSVLLNPGPASNTMYTLTVERPTCTNQASLQIDTTDLPVIQDFTSDQIAGAAGSPFTLTWDVLAADTVLLNGMDVTGTNQITVVP